MMTVYEIIKNVGFELKHTDKNLYDIHEIYFYKHYKLVIDYNIESETDDDKTYSILYHYDKKDMNVMDVFSERKDYIGRLFSKQSHEIAIKIMNEEFHHDIRKSKINKLIK